MIISRTPVRIPLGGGGTDLPSYSSKYGGFLISAAIDKYTFITLNRRPLDRRIRVSYSRTETVSCVDEIQHALVREALRLTRVTGGVEITSIADVPAGSGLGNSSSFTVSLLNALHTLRGEYLTPAELAEEACRIEIDILGEPIGKHDQYIAAFGGIRCLDIDRTGHVSAYSPCIKDDTLEDLQYHTLLFYTGLVRSASEVLSEQNKASNENDAGVINALHGIKEIGLEIKNTLECGNLTRFGQLLDDHWQLKKQLSGKVSSANIDNWYEIARANGAIGGKIMGAGNGGFFMFYCEDGKDGLRKALLAEGLIELRFRLDFQGSKVIANL